MNGSKTKAMIVSWSRTMDPQSPPLTIGGTVLMTFDILGITFDSKMTFANHLHSVSRAVSQRLEKHSLYGAIRVPYVPVWVRTNRDRVF